MSSDSILDKIDNMLGKKKKEETTKTPDDKILYTYPNLDLIDSVSKNINELSSQINDLKSSILLNSKQQSNDLKEFNETIKNIAPIVLPFTVSTKIINTWNIKASKIYNILKRKGTGRIREFRISTTHNFSIYLKTDETELLNIHSSFENLEEISKLSNDILSIKDKEMKTIILKNINFNYNIELSAIFEGDVDIKNIFCIYDIKTTL